jgi:phage gp36-like protein
VANAVAVTLRALSEAIGNGDGAAVALGPSRTALTLSVCVAAIGSLDRLEPQLETSPDGTSGWRVVAVLERIEEPCTVERAFVGLEQYVRVTWVGTGTATFSVEGEAHTVYAGRSHLTGRSAKAILERAERNPDNRDSVATALIDASSTAESELAPANGLPLTKWPNVVRRNVVALALYDLAVIGAFQGAGIDELVAKNQTDALSWFKRAAKHDVHIVGAEPESVPEVHLSESIDDDCDPGKFSDNWGDY